MDLQVKNGIVLATYGCCFANIQPLHTERLHLLRTHHTIRICYLISAWVPLHDKALDQRRLMLYISATGPTLLAINNVKHSWPTINDIECLVLVDC